MLRHIALAALALATAVAGAAPAQAAAAVRVTSAGTISGTPVVGAKLTVSNGSWSGPRGTYVVRAWLRCNDGGTWSCASISGTNSTSYTVVAADRGKQLRVKLYAIAGWDWDSETSSATAVIGTAPTPTPTPDPIASPTPEPTPEPTVVPEATPEPEPQPAPAVAEAPVLTPTTAVQPKMMRPYPTVRVAGRLTASGAYLTRFTVRAPKGARIAVKCAGRHCPRRTVAQAAGLVHIKPFERSLRAGTKLTITVSKPGYFTKVTRISIRRGKVPLRTDGCQAPGQTKLIRCPAR